MMAEDLNQFLESQKVKLAQHKAKLENDPPYMEMQNKSSEKLSETSKMLISMAKENIPPNNQHTAVHDYGLSLPLGEEYEQKKHKLKEELRQDYRRYLSQEFSQAKKKKKYLSSGEDLYTQGLSLPIGERKSAKDRLRLERNKEYNQYLREKEEWTERLRKAGKKQAEYDLGKHTKSLTLTRSQPELQIPALLTRRDEELSKKDACTSTEAHEGLYNMRISLDQYHKPDKEIGHGDGILYKKIDEELNVSNRKHQLVDSKPVTSARQHHKFDRDCDPEISDEMDPRFRYESDYDKRPLRVFHVQRSQGSSPVNAETQSVPGSFPYPTGLILGVQDKELLQRRKEQYRQELIEQIAEQQRNKRREKELELPVAASGALDPEKKPDRLRELGLTPRRLEERIPPERPKAAFLTPTPGPTSVSAPPVLPVNEDFHRGLSSTLGEMLAPSSDKYYGHNGKGWLGATHDSFPQIVTLPPPPPPVLTDNCRTPYDDAYYFYGARNPLDPSLAYYGTSITGVQPSSAPPTDTIKIAPPETLSKIGVGVAYDKPKGLGIFPEEKPKSTREVNLTYQQELEQQIKEREERRRKEKLEKERYEAKLEADMRSYNPWGKGGGGAPLRDKKGNLITDLNMMHKQNEDAYHNPEARMYEDKRAIVSVDLTLASPRLENTDESTNKIAGFTYTQTSPYARGNVFGEPPTPEQIRRQESYKNFLRFQTGRGCKGNSQLLSSLGALIVPFLGSLSAGAAELWFDPPVSPTTTSTNKPPRTDNHIEEKKRREEEEREKRRLEEEREERKLAEQRAKIQREYEEELEKRRRKEEEQRLKNEELYRLSEERRKEAERKRTEEDERQEKQLQQISETEKHKTEEEKISRQPSPLIPSLQNKGIVKEERSVLVESRTSYYTHDVPRAHSPPVPARRNQLRAFEERKNVINELSEMRKQLRSEERRLQEELLKVHSDDDDMTAKGRKKDKHSMDVFEMARLRMQAPVRRPSSRDVADPVNLQNIHDFNELKYKDSETRVETRYMYPDPPTNNETLDIQQQALLREQNKKLQKLRKTAEAVLDFEDPVPSFKTRDRRLLKNDSDEFMKTSLLESESAFIGTNGETFPNLEEDKINLGSLPAISARDRRREKKKDDAALRFTPPLQSDNISLHSSSSVNIDQLEARNEERLRRLNELQKKAMHIADISLANAEDILNELPGKGGRRSNSVDTVATEPWLRPGTSESLKRFIAEQSNQAKLPSETNLSFNWQGLSTAHG